MYALHEYHNTYVKETARHSRDPLPEWDIFFHMHFNLKTGLHPLFSGPSAEAMSTKICLTYIINVKLFAVSGAFAAGEWGLSVFNSMRTSLIAAHR
jgi:hypothetical protein